MDPYRLDDSVRVTGYISLDRLAGLLRRETSVIDGDDVDSLMAVIREQAAAH